jgi:iron complex transport system ATP-binding protein
VVGLLGPNGAGKSTLLRAILQLIPTLRGRIEIEGDPVSRIPVDRRARSIAYLAQHGPVSWPLTVERLVALGRFPHRSSWQRLSREDQTLVEKILEHTDLHDLRSRTVSTLSGGERTRVLLARALAVDAPLLLADEPVAALDPAHQLQIMRLLRDYSRRDHAVVVVMHDLTLAARFCHRLALMDQGALTAVGPAREVLTPQNLSSAYHIEARISDGDDFFVVPWESTHRR